MDKSDINNNNNNNNNNNKASGKRKVFKCFTCQEKEWQIVERLRVQFAESTGII